LGGCGALVNGGIEAPPSFIDADADADTADARPRMA
jgi:hypothetical protein